MSSPKLLVLSISPPFVSSITSLHSPRQEPRHDARAMSEWCRGDSSSQQAASSTALSLSSCRVLRCARVGVVQYCTVQTVRHPHRVGQVRRGRRGRRGELEGQLRRDCSAAVEPWNGP